MRIDAVTVEPGQFILHTPDTREAMKLSYEFKPGDYELKKIKKRRSLDANAYCWALATEIAAAINMSKEEVYRRAIREGNTYVPCNIPNGKVEEFCRAWQSNGIGWFCVLADQGATAADRLIFAYQGSSTYDTKQMAALIDRLIQDASAIGIETLSERERSLLLEDWGK